MSTIQSQQEGFDLVTAAKILVVEDEGLIALDIENHLLALGYQVAGLAETGADAIQLALESEPDLILMDIRLKGEMDGIEAAASITSQLDIPIIFLTAFADSQTLYRAKLISPFGYIRKPFEAIDLHTNIEIALHKHRSEQEIKQQRTWLNTVLESIREVVVADDHHGSVTSMDRVAESITQWQKQKVDTLSQDVKSQSTFECMNNDVPLDDLAKLSVKDLAKCVEAGLNANAHSITQTGLALKEIHRRGEYLTTFEAFVTDRFALTRSRAYQLMHAADIIADLAGVFAPNQLPRSESAVRPMISLTKQQRIEVWRRALEDPRSFPGFGTVKAIVEQMQTS